MKRCSYCGTEYPDDATVCALDQTPFDQTHFAEEPKAVATIMRKIPMLLSIVSCYLFASGIFQIGWCAMLGRYMGNIPPLNIAYGILIIFVSRGLRRGSRRWYICALVVAGLVISAICLEIIHGFIHSVSMRSLCLDLFSLAVWLCITLALTRPVIRNFFFYEPDVAT